jgi:hypothetical protein
MTTTPSLPRWQRAGRRPGPPRGPVAAPSRTATASPNPAGCSRSSIRPTGTLPLWINGESLLNSPRGTLLLCPYGI